MAREWVFTDDAGVEVVSAPCACMVTVDQAGAGYMQAVVNMLNDHVTAIAGCEGGDEAKATIGGQPIRITLTWKITLPE